MKMMTKNLILAASLISMSILTACQSTTAATEKPSEHRMMGKHHGGDQRGHRHHMKRMTPENMTTEQRARWEQHQAERQAHFEQMQKACEGKSSGQPVQMKMGEKTIEGSCEMRFQPNKAQRMMYTAPTSTATPVQS